MRVGQSLFQVNPSYDTITNMRDRMGQLEQQLATGKRSSTLSGLGQNRVYDLMVRTSQSRIEGYQSNIQTVELRLSFFDNAITQLDIIESDARSSATSGGSGSDGLGMTTAQSLSYARLDEVIGVLNTEINGRYYFGGSTSDAAPVESLSNILDGEGGRDGFRTIVIERKAADAGTDGRGRVSPDIADLITSIGPADTVTLTEDDAVLHPQRPQITGIATNNAANVTVASLAGPPVEVTAQFTSVGTPGDTITIDITLPDGSVEPRVFTAVAGTPTSPDEYEIGATPDDTATNFQAALDAVMVSDTVTLTEDGDHPFGFKLSTLYTDSAAVTIDSPDGVAPQTLNIRFTDAPLVGDIIRVGLTLPNGDTEIVEFSAVEGTPGADGEFEIGATPADTAANFQSILDAKLLELGDTKLEAASVYAAADNFFNGRGETIMRVDGPPFDTATALIAATAADTVSWYKGEDTSGAPRRTVTARIDDSTDVFYGVQGNESGLVQLVSSLAAMAVETYPDSDANAGERYSAMSKIQLGRLSEGNNGQAGSIEGIALELGIATAAVGNAKERHNIHMVQFDTMLADIENVMIEEVAMQLLDLQIRLEASYQTMASVSRLSLVNYIQ